MSSQSFVSRVRTAARIDLAPTHPQPPLGRIMLATVAALAGSLLADAVLVKLGTSLFPSTRHYGHFRFSDYGTLTTVGVVAAGGAWAVVTRVTSSPRWLFIRLAIVVTVVLWLPDGWLILKGEPFRAVAVLMAMHLAIAIVSYNILVRGAAVGHRPAEVSPVGERPGAVGPDRGPATALPGDPRFAVSALAETLPSDPATISGPEAAPSASRSAWVAMAGGVALEVVLGVAELFVVPLNRPTQWLPSKAEPLYVAHAVLGAALGLGGLVLLRRAARAGRLARIGAVTGMAGLAIGAVGGILATYHSSRLAGLGLMLVGAVVAAFGYLTPVLA